MGGSVEGRKREERERQTDERAVENEPARVR
jgi:hypothetical protein